MIALMDLNWWRISETDRACAVTAWEECKILPGLTYSTVPYSSEHNSLKYPTAFSCCVHLCESLHGQSIAMGTLCAVQQYCKFGQQK
jgi:hypothetical protein